LAPDRVLELDKVSVRHGRTEAVREVSMRVGRGEVVGLVGPNGAGKSTLLAAISGQLRPARGTIAFEGEPIAGETPERLVRRGIALVPEGRRIFTTLTVEENLRLPTFARKAADTGALIERELERFPILRTYLHQHAGRMSGGEQQMLAISRGLLSGPRLLMLDEPSLGLAPKMIDAVFEALDGLRGEGVTVLLVEQNATRTIAFADRSYVLANGRVTAAGTRDELSGLEQVTSSYLGLEVGR
jgi:branched-chain amino acid transport system ATP-binding protein